MADFQNNFMNALQGGYQFGQQIKQQRDQSNFNRLAGEAYSAPQEQRQGLIGQAIGINPQAGMALNKGLQGDEETRNKTIANAARLLTSAPEQYRPQLYQNIRGDLARFIPGMPEQYDQTVAEAAQSIAQAYSGLDGNTPTGFREFDMKAKAAGLKPGTPEYEDAAKTDLGLKGRASNAGFRPDTIEWNGRKYPARFNPRDGVQELWDGNQWIQLGGSMGDPSVPTGSSPPAAPQGGTQQIVDAIAEQANRMIAAGLPEAQVTAWVEQQLQGGAQGSMPQPAAPAAPAGPMGPVAPAGIGVSRTKEEDAAAVTAAQEAAKLRYLQEELELRTRADIEKTAGVEDVKNKADRAKNEPKARLALEQATARVNRVDSLVNSIMPRIGTLTAGWLGGKLSGVDGTAAADLRRDLGTLQAIAGFDELNAMRAASPTGGALGNVTERELAFLQSVVRNIENSQSPEQLRRNLAEFQQELKGSWQRVANAYQQDYGQSMQGAPAAQGRGPQPGTVEDGYRFRGGDPADPNNWERM